jgi:hypothetical protein
MTSAASGSSRLTVGQYLDQWLEGKGRLRSSTKRSYREHIDLYFRPCFGHLRLTDLREVDIERLSNAMAQPGEEGPRHRSGLSPWEWCSSGS